MSDGISIEFFSEIRCNSPIIFTTSFAEHAVQAFKLNSIDYLLKPVQLGEIEAAFAKFNAFQRKYSSPLDWGKSYKVKFKEDFNSYQSSVAQMIEEKDIAYFLKKDLVFIVQADKRKSVTQYRSLHEVEEIVDPAKYFRANRQFLVRRNMITGYRRDNAGRLTLRLKIDVGETVTVSKEKAAEFKKWI